MTGDLSNPINQLAILCGLMFIPHILAAFVMPEPVFGFFRSAGYRPVAFFVYFSVVTEIAVATLLILGVRLPLAATVAAIFMFTAAASVLKVSKGQWLWNLGGCELHMFWGICCVIVAMHS